MSAFARLLALLAATFVAACVLSVALLLGGLHVMGEVDR